LALCAAERELVVGADGQYQTVQAALYPPQYAISKSGHF